MSPIRWKRTPEKRSETTVDVGNKREHDEKHGSVSSEKTAVLKYE